MKSFDKESTARLPLIESVIIIAVFAIVSVAILRLYLASDRIQQRAVNVSKATILAENEMEELMCGAAGSVSSVRRFDSEWNETGDETEAAFTVTAGVTDSEQGTAGTLEKVYVLVTAADNEELARIESSVYRENH